MENKNETSAIGQQIQKNNSVMPPSKEQGTMPSSADDRSPREGTRDDLANFDATERQESGNIEQEGEEPRRYDEADPNWKNPDVQMQNQNAENANQPQNTSLDVNMPNDAQLS